MIEKRKNERYKVKMKSEVSTDEFLTYSDAVDVSKGGIFISTPEPIVIGSSINLSIQLPGSEPMEMRGIVKWVRNDEKEGERAGMGIEFSDIADGHRDLLKKYLK